MKILLVVLTATQGSIRINNLKNANLVPKVISLLVKQKSVKNVHQVKWLMKIQLDALTVFLGTIQTKKLKDVNLAQKDISLLIKLKNAKNALLDKPQKMKHLLNAQIVKKDIFLMKLPLLANLVPRVVFNNLKNKVNVICVKLELPLLK
jgi:hypothetical protein